MNTIITEKNEDGSEFSYDVFTKLVDDRILFLSDFISDDVASNIIATLIFLEQENKKDKISIYINSEGGDVRSVFMIYDIMKMLKSPIETICIGTALGESALILAAGTKGMRKATKSSIIRLNQLIHEYSKYSDMTSAETLLAQSKSDNQKFIKELRSCTGKSVSVLQKDTERDFYLTPSDAKKYGIIDSIVGEKNVIKSKKAR